MSEATPPYSLYAFNNNTSKRQGWVGKLSCLDTANTIRQKPLLIVIYFRASRHVFKENVSWIVVGGGEEMNYYADY